MNNQQIRSFIVCYANQHALPLPGRLPYHRDFTVMLLPSDTTKVMVHKVYQEAAATQGYTSVSYSQFIQLWSYLCPHISVIKPSSDLCPLCQKNMMRLRCVST